MKAKQDVDKRYQNFYFPTDLLKQIYVESKRLELSLSKVVHLAWELSYEAIKARPTVRFEPLVLPPEEVKTVSVGVLAQSEASRRMRKKYGG